MENQDSRFAERVFRLLERVEYRRADSQEEKRAIYGMRHDAYTRAGTVEPRPSGLFHDPLDESPNAWLIGLYIDGVLASALRLHVSADLSAILPATAAFGTRESPRLAFLACVAIFHAVDRVAEAEGKDPAHFRQIWANECLEFKLINVIAHHFKHVLSTRET